MLFGRLLDAEVLEHRDAAGGADPPRRGAEQLLVDAASPRVVGDRDLAQASSTGSESLTCSARNSSIDEVLLDERRGERRQAPGVGPRAHPEVEVGELRGVGDDRVDDDHRALRVLGDLLAGRGGRAGTTATSTGSCRRRPRPRRARTRRGCGRRRAASRPSPRPSSPGRARSSGSASRAPSGRRRCRRRRGGCPARRRRSRRSTRRRARRRRRSKPAATSAIAVSQSTGSYCRRRSSASASSAGGGRSGSGRGASPCCRCSPASRDGRDRPGSCSASVPRAGPRSRSCTRRGCRRSASTRPTGSPSVARSLSVGHCGFPLG